MLLAWQIRGFPGDGHEPEQKAKRHKYYRKRWAATSCLSAALRFFSPNDIEAVLKRRGARLEAAGHAFVVGR